MINWERLQKRLVDVVRDEFRESTKTVRQAVGAVGAASKTTEKGSDIFSAIDGVLRQFVDEPDPPPADVIDAEGHEVTDSTTP